MPSASAWIDRRRPRSSPWSMNSVGSRPALAERLQLTPDQREHASHPLCGRGQHPGAPRRGRRRHPDPSTPPDRSKDRPGRPLDTPRSGLHRRGARSLRSPPTSPTPTARLGGGLRRGSQKRPSASSGPCRYETVIRLVVSFQIRTFCPPARARSTWRSTRLIFLRPASTEAAAQLYRVGVEGFADSLVEAHGPPRDPRRTSGVRPVFHRHSASTLGSSSSSTGIHVAGVPGVKLRLCTTSTFSSLSPAQYLAETAAFHAKRIVFRPKRKLLVTTGLVQQRRVPLAAFDRGRSAQLRRPG